MKADESEKGSATQSLGGKAASLKQLDAVEGIRVPKWFCLTTNHFKNFIDHNHISEKIEAFDNDLSNPYEKAAEIRELILSGEYSNEFYHEIKNNIGPILKQGPAAVRSSSVIEDMAESSFAGVYDTFLNQRDEKAVIESVKQCWASVFNDRAVFERNRNCIPHKKALIAVVIQQMVDAEVAGTAFTMEIGTGYEGIEIVANFGLGESVVDGEVTADKWLLHSQNHHILKSTLGSKKHKVASVNDNSGTLNVELSEEEQSRYVMSDEKVKEIATSLQKIAAHYSYPHLDTEFAIDKSGVLYFLQARSLVSVPVEDLQVVNEPSHKALAKGRYSVPGAAVGNIKFIPSFEDLASGRIVIEPSDIVVTYVSTNKWTQFMTHFKGMITQEGGPTSHPILLCRERKVPCVIGIQPDAFSKLIQLNGTLITLDGLNQNIYVGEMPLKQASKEDFKSRFDVIRPEVIGSFEEQIQSFKDYNLLIVDEGSYWQKKPTYRLDILMRDINLKGYQKRSKILGLDFFPSDAKVIDGYLVERFMTEQEKLVYFSHFDVDQAVNFVKEHENTLKRYQELTDNFSLTKTNWREYVDLMSTLRGYIWLGYNFRLYANNKAAMLGEELMIPRFYVEAYAAQLQEEQIEEDTRLLEDMNHMAIMMAPYADMSLAQIKEQKPAIYNELIKLAFSYRFQDCLSFSAELDINLVFTRIINEIKNIDSDVESTSSIKHDYFPEETELKLWIESAVRNRIAQSNTHHLIIRGQWKVRAELLKLGEKDKIFNLSVDQVEDLIGD